MRATRRTQPYRAKTGRSPGPVLDAMRRGRPALSRNPQDLPRKTGRKRRRKRGALSRATARRS